MTAPWRIATRRSRLARVQARSVADALERTTSRPAQLVPMATTGDSDPKRAIEAFDTKGLFVDATREAVGSGDCDLVVHSFKDLPTRPVDGLTVAAVPPRADPRDVVVLPSALAGRAGDRVLPPGRSLTLGTSSARRRVQLTRLHPQPEIEPVRGNVGTRLEKVAIGELDGVVVAMAGLQRLGELPDGVRQLVLSTEQCLPAPAQGALAVECREDDAATRAALERIGDPDAARCVRAERAMLAALEGGCTAPIAALARVVDGQGGLHLEGMVADRDELHRVSASGSVGQPEQLGRRVAEMLRERGPGIVDRLGGDRTQGVG